MGADQDDPKQFDIPITRGKNTESGIGRDSEPEPLVARESEPIKTDEREVFAVPVTPGPHVTMHGTTRHWHTTAQLTLHMSPGAAVRTASAQVHQRLTGAKSLLNIAFWLIILFWSLIVFTPAFSIGWPRSFVFECLVWFVLFLFIAPAHEKIWSAFPPRVSRFAFGTGLVALLVPFVNHVFLIMSHRALFNTAMSGEIPLRPDKLKSLKSLSTMLLVVQILCAIVGLMLALKGIYFLDAIHFSAASQDWEAAYAEAGRMIFQDVPLIANTLLPDWVLLPLRDLMLWPFALSLSLLLFHSALARAAAPVSPARPQRAESAASVEPRRERESVQPVPVVIRETAVPVADGGSSAGDGRPQEPEAVREMRDEGRGKDRGGELDAEGRDEEGYLKKI